MVTELRADGMPASADERALRRMLCTAYEIMPYTDDGEASGQNFDWMRSSIEDIGKRIYDIGLERYKKSLQLHEEVKDQPQTRGIHNDDCMS